MYWLLKRVCPIVINHNDIKLFLSAVLEYRKQHGPPTTLTNHKEPVETEDNEIGVESRKAELPEDNEEDYCDPYADLYSDSEDDDK